MLNVALDIANNLAAFIVSVITIAGAIVGGVVWLVKLSLKQSSDKKETDERIKNLETQTHEKIKSIEDQFDENRARSAGDYIKMEGKLDAFQITMGQLVKGVSRIEGFMEARSQHNSHE